MIYPNHYIASLAKAEKRRGDMGVSPTKGDLHGGFIEVPLETDSRREDRDQAEQICTLSRMQLQDLQAQVVTVLETGTESNYIRIRLPDGREETAYCNYSDRLKIGDELYVTVRQRGRQRTIKILGLVPPDQRKKEENV